MTIGSRMSSDTFNDFHHRLMVANPIASIERAKDFVATNPFVPWPERVEALKRLDKAWFALKYEHSRVK